MKTITILATAAVAAIAAPAFAQDSNNHDVTIKVEGSTPAKCNIASDDTSIILTGYDLTNDQGKVRTNVDQKVANALSGLNLKAWCNGARNGVAVSRSALITGNGNATTTGFNQAIVYDLNVLIDGATRDGAAFFDGTSDGPANGPGIGSGSGIVVPAFGPTGQGSKISFVTEPGTSVAAVTNGQGGAEVTRASFNGAENNAARMVAGTYTGTVTLTLTPGN
jgi:hypothetical protein